MSTLLLPRSIVLVFATIALSACASEVADGEAPSEPPVVQPVEVRPQPTVIDVPKWEAKVAADD